METLPWLLAVVLGAPRDAAPPQQPADTAPPQPPADTGTQQADDAARAAARRAKQHFARDEWDLAIDALVEAYAHNLDVNYLYARAQAERMRGDCRVAVVLYERFLEGDPTPEQRRDTRTNIRRCQETLKTEQSAAAMRTGGEPDTTTQPPPGTALAPPAEVANDAPSVAASQDRPRPWHRDPLGGSLLAASVAVLGAGSTTWVIGTRGRTAAVRAATEGSYEEAAGRGRTATGVGIALVGVGVALAAGAALRYGLVARRRPPVTVAFVLHPQRLGIAGTVRF